MTICASILKTCVRGHEQTPENLYTSKDGKKQCRLCRRAIRLGRVQPGYLTKNERQELAQAEQEAARAKEAKRKGSGVICPPTYRAQLAREAMGRGK